MSDHEPESSTIYHDRWCLSGQVLELQDWAYSPGTERESGPMTYRFDFTRGLGRVFLRETRCGS